MRLLRFLCLLAAIAVVYFAQYIFDYGSLTEFFPEWFLARFSFASRLMRWQPEDLRVLAWGGSALAAIIFGLITPAWPSVQGLSYVTPIIRKGRQPNSLFAIVALVLSLLLTTFVYADVTLPLGSFGAQGAWFLSCVFVLFTGSLLNRPRSLQVRSVSSSSPERGWLLLLLIAVGAGLLFSFNLLELPPNIELQSAKYGLQAQSMLNTNQPLDLLSVGATGQPLITTLVTALAIKLSGDTLFGMRAAGVAAGVLLVIATWLVGCELFRRVARRGRQDEVLEDDGRFPALLSAAVITGCVTVIHVSRLPVLFEPIAWGTFGVWALLRGMRRADSFGLALAGLLGGYSALIHPSGMTILLLMVCLLLPGTLIPGMGYPRAIAEARRSGWAIWLLGVICVLAPTLRIWLTHSESLWLDFPGVGQGLLRNGFRNLLSLQTGTDNSLLLGYSGHLLHSVLAPLTLLALGCLLMNVDRLPGWVLTIWFAVSCVVAAALNPQISSWSALLPILPAISLAVAFAIDRVRSTLFETVGGWLNQSAIYLGLGIVLWAALANWIDYVHFIDTQRDAASEMAIAIRQFAPDQKFIIVDTEDGRTPQLDNPVLQLIENDRDDLTQIQTVPASQLTADIVPQSILLIVPEGRDALVRVQSLYPDGVLKTERDRRGNPVLYLFETQ